MYNLATGYTDSQVSSAVTYIENASSAYTESIYNLATGYTDSQLADNLPLYVTTGTTQHISGEKTFDTTVYMLNGLYVSGTTTFLNTQNLNVYNNFITINSGETGSGVTAGFAGIKVDRGSSPNYEIQWNEDQGNFRVGQTGQTQAVATREDTPTNYAIATWDAPNFRFVTNVLSPASFLSANTSYYTQTQANDNFLSATTLATIESANSAYTLMMYNQATGYTDQQILLVSSATTTASSAYTLQMYNQATGYTNITVISAITYIENASSAYTESMYNEATGYTDSQLTNYYTSFESDANFLSANTSDLIIKYTMPDVSAATVNIDSYSNTVGVGVVWHYTITSGSTNRRTGTMNVVYNSTVVDFNDTSTPPLGTVDCELTAVNTGTYIQLQVESITGTYTIYVTRIIIG